MAQHLSLLAEPLLSVQTSAGREALTLPELLARLAEADECEPVAVRAHQHHGWYAFLVQLAALVAHRWGTRDLARPPAEWKEALIALAGDGGEAAWALAVDDLSKPAFLQPPVPEGSLAPLKNRFETPDELDVLVTAKNHDEKQSRMRAARPEHWVYALVALQTMQGFLGRGNYGIARMNGGFSSRPGVALAPSLSFAARFRRDIGVWLDRRVELCSEDYGYREEGGHALLWLLPWTGGKEESLAMASLDPFFLEVCRRVRLQCDPAGRLVALAGNTEAPRIDAKLARGRTGDVWTPVSADGEALTVAGRGFHYRLLADLLLTGRFPDHERAASRPRRDDGPSPWFAAEVLTRGQGKTEGFHQRLLRIPAPVRSLLEQPDARAALARRAQERIDRVATAQRKVLHPALCTLLQGGAEDLDLRDDRTRPWLDRFDQRVDDEFFDALWEDSIAAGELDEADERWNERLRRWARQELADAANSAPVALATLPKAEARAWLRFGALAHRHLPLSVPVAKEEAS